MNNEKTESGQLPLKRNRMYSLRAVFFVFFSVVMLTQAQAQTDWNQFRGYARSGVITFAGFPDVLPEQGPELLWTKDVGNGFSEVATSGDAAYIMSSDSLEGGYEYVAAFDIDSGNELWKTRVDSMWFEVDGWGHGPRSTTAIDHEALYCLSGFGKFSALSKKNGKILWMVNLPEEFGTTIPRWGFSTSPVVVEDIVILETGGVEARTFTAFDKKTGEVKWSRGNGNASYNSPVIATIDGQTNIVFALDTMLYAYNPAGEEIWNFRMPLRAPMSIPVFMEPNRFFVSSVSRTGGFVVEVNGSESKEVFTSTTMQNEWSSSCYKDGYLYGFSRAKLQCVSAETGVMMWGKRGFGKGSLIIVDDKLVVLSDQGKIIVVDANPQEYKELGSFQALDGKSWTAPSFAEGKLFVRNLSKMSCFKLSK